MRSRACGGTTTNSFLKINKALSTLHSPLTEGFQRIINNSGLSRPSAVGPLCRRCGGACCVVASSWLQHQLAVSRDGTPHKTNNVRIAFTSKIQNATTQPPGGLQRKIYSTGFVSLGRRGRAPRGGQQQQPRFDGPRLRAGTQQPVELSGRNHLFTGVVVITVAMIRRGS